MKKLTDIQKHDLAGRILVKNHVELDSKIGRGLSGILLCLPDFVLFSLYKTE